MKFFNKNKLLFRILFVAFAVLFTFVATGNVIATENKKAINKFLKITDYDIVDIGGEAVDTDYFKSDYENLASLMDDGQKLAEEVKGEKKDSFEVTGNLEFVAATADGVHVYIDGEEQELETNANGLVDMTFSFADYLSKWEEENGVKSSSSSSSSSNSASSDSSSSSSESSSDSADTQADTSSTADTAVDAGTNSAEPEVPAADQGTYTNDAGTVDNGAGYTDEASGSATTDGL